MRRSRITVDLGGDPAERRAPPRDGGAGRALGGREGGRLRARSGRRRARRARGRRLGLCVATAREGEDLREAFPVGAHPRHEPAGPRRGGAARDARLEVALSSPDAPEGLDVHVKVDTGMGRWGMTLEEALTVPRRPRRRGHEPSRDRRRGRTSRSHASRSTASARSSPPFPGVTRPPGEQRRRAPFPRGALRRRPLRDRAVRAVAVRRRPRRHGLEPALSWRSYVAHVRELPPGESTGYGRRFVAEEPTRVGIVPVGYADGFRRGPHRHGGARRREPAARRRHDLDGLPRRRARATSRPGPR